MKPEEFKLLIESIGFKFIGNNYYSYKEFRIYLHINYYNFYNGSKVRYSLNDLTPILKLTRSIKLKNILQ